MAAKAGDIKPLPYTLQTIAGVAAAYADKTALLAAGWTFELYIGGVLVITPTWTWATVNAAAGQGELSLTLQAGQGTAYLRPPNGFLSNVEVWDLDVENNSLDLIAAKIDASAGTPSPDDRSSSMDFTITEGDSFNRILTVPSTALADFGITDLSTVTAVSGAARARINRVDTLPDFTFTAVIVSTTLLTLAIGWTTFPTGASIGAYAITGVNTGTKTFTIAGDQRKYFDGITRLLMANSTGNDGYYTIASMALVAGATVFTVNETVNNSTVDGSIAQADETKAFLYDVQIQFPKTFAVTAVSTVSKTFTLSGDQRRWFNVGGAFAIAGSTGNDGAFTVVTLALVGGNTVITVSQTVSSAVADGSATATQKVTTNKGVFTITRQEDRT